jgi:hypothetical protein
VNRDYSEAYAFPLHGRKNLTKIPLDILEETVGKEDDMADGGWASFELFPRGHDRGIPTGFPLRGIEAPQSSTKGDTAKGRTNG